jgi:uncharacterized protein (DUF58 family)
MFRLSYRIFRIGSWVRYTVPRRFTSAGLLALSGLGVTAAIGVDMDQTVAFQGLALLLCLLAVAVVASWFFRGQFSAQRWLPRFGSVGEPLTYLVTVRNRNGRRVDHLELFEDLADPRPTLAEYTAGQQEQARAGRRWFLWARTRPPDVRRALIGPTPLPALPPSGQAEARVEVMPLKRGPLRFTGLTVARPDPLGWFRGFVRLPLPQSVLILPKRYPLPAFSLPGVRQYQRGGVVLASAIGESEEFLALRDYRPGDPLRHIHWKSWARTGRPIVREFEDEFMVRHALILDTFAGPGQAAAFEEAVSVAASFACTVDTQESLLDLLFVGTQALCFTTGRGLGQSEQALEILASVQPCRTQTFSVLHELVMRHASSTCGCIVILLAWDESRRELVRRLRSLGLPLVVLVVATEEALAAIRRAPGDDQPERFHLLELGQVGEGLERITGGFDR